MSLVKMPLCIQELDQEACYRGNLVQEVLTTEQTFCWKLGFLVAACSDACCREPRLLQDRSFAALTTSLEGLAQEARKVVERLAQASSLTDVAAVMLELGPAFAEMEGCVSPVLSLSQSCEVPVGDGPGLGFVQHSIHVVLCVCLRMPGTVPVGQAPRAWCSVFAPRSGAPKPWRGWRASSNAPWMPS